MKNVVHSGLSFLFIFLSAITEVNAEKNTPQELALIRIETPQAFIVLVETVVAGVASGAIITLGTLSMPEDDIPTIIGLILPVTSSVAAAGGGGATIMAAKAGCKIEELFHNDVEFPGWGGVIGAGAVAGGLVTVLVLSSCLFHSN